MRIYKITSDRSMLNQMQFTRKNFVHILNLFFSCVFQKFIHLPSSAAKGGYKLSKVTYFPSVCILKLYHLFFQEEHDSQSITCIIQQLLLIISPSVVLSATFCCPSCCTAQISITCSFTAFILFHCFIQCVELSTYFPTSYSFTFYHFGARDK